jgi:hypothetical protein
MEFDSEFDSDEQDITADSKVAKIALLLDNISCAQYFYNGTSGTHLETEDGQYLLTQMLDMITYDQMKTHTLCVDGKKINVSSSQVDGEVNLFDFEDKPT